MNQRRVPIKQRLITALIALPLVLFVTLVVDQGWFAVTIGAVAAIALREFYTLTLPAQRRNAQWLAIVSGVLILLVAGSQPTWLVPMLTMSFVVVGSYFLWNYQDLQTVISQLAVVVMGWLYIPLLMSPMVLLHGMVDGRRWVLLVLIMTMVCDSCAYFVGSAVGRHRLYAAISPKKSIEGACGGLGGAVVVALTAPLWLLPQTGWLDCLCIGVLAGVFGQVGDLFESMLKRAAEVKDSGTLFPGHGGMLDRLDSLLFSFPVVYVYHYLRSGIMQ